MEISRNTIGIGKTRSRSANAIVREGSEESMDDIPLSSSVGSYSVGVGNVLGNWLGDRRVWIVLQCRLQSGLLGNQMWIIKICVNKKIKRKLIVSSLKKFHGNFCARFLVSFLLCNNPQALQRIILCIPVHHSGVEVTKHQQVFLLESVRKKPCKIPFSTRCMLVQSFCCTIEPWIKTLAQGVVAMLFIMNFDLSLLSEFRKQTKYIRIV